MLKDILIKLCDNRFAVSAALGQLDRSLLAKGQLLLTPQAITSLLTVFADDSLTISEILPHDDGTVSFSARSNGGMELNYSIRLNSLTIRNGSARGEGTYTESRRGGGIGGALLGMTGKNGLTLALAKYKWIKADASGFTVDASGLPADIGLSYVRTSRQGILFRIA